MRIGFIIPADFALSSPGNGVRRQALSQAEALRALGHDVVLLNPWSGGAATEFDVIQFFVGGFGTWLVEKIPLPATAIRVWAPIIDSNEPNWRYRLATAAGSVYSRLKTIPSVFRAQALGSDLTVVRSTHERDRVVRGLGIDASRVRVVLNGAEIPETAPDPRRAAALTGGDEPYVLQIGAYTQTRKRAIDVAHAVAPLGLKLVIAGSAEPGGTLDTLRAIAATYPNVRLLGYLDRADRDALYAGCRVFCLPSEHEGTGLVALEAAALGARIVITRRGGAPDYFGAHARYVNPGDIAGIRAAVRAAFDEVPQTTLRDHVRATLTWRHSAKALVDAYRETLARGGLAGARIDAG